MTTLISLFLISFITISIMFSKKLALLENGNIKILENQNRDLGIPFMSEVKYVAIRKIKRGGYIGIVLIIRSYFRSKNLLKKTSEKIKGKINNLYKTEINNNTEKTKTNRFLKVMSDYKHKIRRIKREVKEEEETE